MNAKEFVACWKREKDSLLKVFQGDAGSSEVAAQIASMNLTAEQLAAMPTVVDAILTDTFYSLLLGLDGAASIGGVQQQYRLHDEDGNLVSEPGDIEGEAWEQFHGESP